VILIGVVMKCCLERSSWLLNPLSEMTKYVYVKLMILESVVVGYVLDCYALIGVELVIN
jgi:hypothetical protein